MDINDTARLLAVIQVGDNRKVDELTIQEWHHAVSDLDAADAVAAVREHRRKSGDYLAPHHVRAGVKRIRDERHKHQRAIDSGPASFDRSPKEQAQITANCARLRDIVQQAAAGTKLPE